MCTKKLGVLNEPKTDILKSLGVHFFEYLVLDIVAAIVDFFIRIFSQDCTINGPAHKIFGTFFICENKSRLNVHADVPSRARGPKSFGLNLHQYPNFVYASCEGSGEFEPSLPADAISTKISCAGPNHLLIK